MSTGQAEAGPARARPHPHTVRKTLPSLRSSCSKLMVLRIIRAVPKNVPLEGLQSGAIEEEAETLPLCLESESF